MHCIIRVLSILQVITYFMNVVLQETSVIHFCLKEKRDSTFFQKQLAEF
jgi:hypothetical protein